jgi:hypothetical protein
MTLARFRQIVADSDLNVLSFRANASSGVAGRVSRLAAEVPGWREFFTLNVYAVLSKPSPGAK